MYKPCDLRWSLLLCSSQFPKTKPNRTGPRKGLSRVNRDFQLGGILPTVGIWQHLQTLLVVTARGGCATGPCLSVAKSCLTLSDPIHGLQHIRLLCPPVSLRVSSNSCPLSQRCYLTIASSATSFFFCLLSFPAAACAAGCQWVKVRHAATHMAAYNRRSSIPQCQQ